MIHTDSSKSLSQSKFLNQDIKFQALLKQLKLTREGKNSSKVEILQH